MTNSPIVWREAMRHTSLLSAMPDDLLAQLAGRATERQFVRGEYACHDGEYSNSLRDQSSGGHLQRMTAYSLLITDQLELPAEGKESLRLGALLHDIGKIGVSDAILHKNGKLTEEEWGLMRKHPA
jgi:HD-GYP domain-containing protein (c-di-GMP phosphodiesterase class II)